jgi:CHASE3 domain sensor protein
MSCRKFLVANLLVILILSSTISGSGFTNAQTDDATTRLEAASSAVEQAFNAVLSAEKAGANVTGLLEQLNVATALLAQADNSYRAGDSSTAMTQADNVLPITNQITIDAQNAKQNAIVSSQNAFWSTIALTVIGVFVFVLVLFLVWRKFKRNYIKSLSEAKPELVSDE